jgi:S1-C subfamily serine protease
MACTTRYCWFSLLAMGVLCAAPARAQESSPGIEAAAAMEKAVVEAIARGEKSVVAIARVRQDAPSETVRIEARADAFGRLLSVQSAPKPTDPSFVPSEYGSGVVVDRHGLILTAYHVLGPESDYYVTTPERKVYAARVVGADPRSDLAILSIDAAGLVPIALGDATTLRKGQFVVTLGNPYAIARDGQATAGWGIVANLARKAPPSPEDAERDSQRTLHHFGTLIQTDAKLNIGSSGGPLLNLKGEMVGLCVALAAAAGYETSTGYAIPVDATFRRVLEVLKQGREVEYGFLGIHPANLEPGEVLAGLHGMRVKDVLPGTPAARFGLKADDVITDVDGTALYDADGLMLAVGKLPVEAVARLSVVRDGRPRIIDVTLGKFPVGGQKIVTTRPEAWRGMRVDYASTLAGSEQPLRAGVAFFDDAVVVSDVAEGSAAQRAGLRPGMLVTHVDDLPVRTPKEFQAAVARKAGEVALHLALEDQEAVKKVAP